MMRAILTLIVTCILCCSAAQASKPDGKRIALVIGNSAYAKAPLKNPASDAQAVALQLKALGFEVMLAEDKNSRALTDTALEFAQKAESRDVRVVYYAGHGAQIKGRNYLVPIDLTFDNEDEIVRKSLDLSELVERLSRQPQAMNVVVIDACRNNPASNVALDSDGRRLKTRGNEGRGLARIDVPAGTLIAYSTAPGQVADDRAGGKHSLYAKHFLSYLNTPGLSIELFFKRVRNAVLTESQNRQQPWDHSSLTVDFCFKADAQGKCSAM
jgi:uncharacterized caspase-like protein